jgi:hypothetical protein
MASNYTQFKIQTEYDAIREHIFQIVEQTLQSKFCYDRTFVSDLMSEIVFNVQTRPSPIIKHSHRELLKQFSPTDSHSFDRHQNLQESIFPLRDSHLFDRQPAVYTQTSDQVKPLLDFQPPATPRKVVMKKHRVATKLTHTKPCLFECGGFTHKLGNLFCTQCMDIVIRRAPTCEVEDCTVKAALVVPRVTNGSIGNAHFITEHDYHRCCVKHMQKPKTNGSDKK